MAGTGLEDRTSILPIPDVTPMGPGLLGPNYSFADNLALPGQVGVRDGDDFNSVIDSVKAVGYYVDMIGFGEASSGLTRGVGPGGGPRPLGVRTWMKTGMKCSNGADMWTHMDGVPDGSALGETIKKGLSSAGLPGMRGLAPGILEDAQSALNPMPVMKAIFGSGYPQCKFEKKEVGDQDGNIQNPTTKDYYIQDYVEGDGTVTKEGNRSYQKRWAYDRDLTQDEWNKAEKTHCADGYRLDNHRDSNCENPLESRAEGFQRGEGVLGFRKSWLTVSVATAIILVTALLLKKESK